MKTPSVILIFIALVTLATSELITFPMSHFHLDQQQSHQYFQYRTQQSHHHLRHFTVEESHETYPIHSLRTIFTLNLNVNGFEYNLSIDTGSSDLFIKGQDMQGNPVRKFSCKECIEKNQYVKIGYLDGHLDTYVHNSTIKLGNHTFDQTILVAYATDRIINFRKIGGIVGLSFQQISRNPYPNFISTLIKEKIISKYRFGLKMNFKDPNTSFITFGGFDHKYVDSAHTLEYYPIMEGKFSYELQIQSVKFGDEILNVDTALLDSGNTCVSIAAEYTEHMLKEMNKGDNKCTFNDEAGNTIFKILVCFIHDFNLLPVIEVKMPDGKVFSWEKEYYIDKCTEQEKTANGTQVYRCPLFIESVKQSGQGLFLGAAWMLKYYSVFDLDEKKIGMAKNVDNPTIEHILERMRKEKEERQKAEKAEKTEEKKEEKKEEKAAPTA